MKWLTDVFSALSVWLNPHRKERQILLGAIESASELIDIYQTMLGNTKTKYVGMKKERLKKFEVHYLKRFLAWRDGRT